jgi:hypothetical protein
MTLLATHEELLARRAVASGPLADLAQGLRADLQPLLDGGVIIPDGKAVLSRAGGRCETDGTLLDYDPFSTTHRCARCGRTYEGEAHDRFRLYWHHLWLAERAVHGALLGVLLDDAAARGIAVTLLEGYAQRYLAYPNADNVLGPSRPFFSTYLESIWLLQLTIALDILETGAPSDEVTALGARVRDRLIQPSATLIASYDEGLSNRQVWNNAALIAAGLQLGDERMVEKATAGPSGLGMHLADGLLADGSWYEGENYHFFAHRGLWYGVRMADVNGHQLAPSFAARFREGFAAPFRTLLPDLTFPSRRDSQYAVSARQPRFAESCELGLARGTDERLISMLARLYDAGVPHTKTGRAASTADVERNLPPTGLSRADLSWRSLLAALPELPPLASRPFTSDLLPAQGLAILRRDEGCSYVALDYGHSGGGHGHPDRLNLLLVDGHLRWFDDPGTGSYVDATLHWYRSTLAHSAPLVDGRSQPAAHGSLVAFDDDGSAGWVSAAVELMPDLVLRRSIVLLDDYLVDVLEWAGNAPHEIGLPLHGVDVVDERGLPQSRRAERVRGGSAREDGFEFLRDAQRVFARANEVMFLRGSRDGIGNATLDGWLLLPGGASVHRALAPDVPARTGLVPMLLIRSARPTGRYTSVWSWRGRVVDVEIDDDEVRISREDGVRESHRSTPEGWRIERERKGAAELIVLAGFASPRTPSRAVAAIGEPPPAPAPIPLPAHAHLGEQHYRRSELSWRDAGEPTADVDISVDGKARLRVSLRVSPSSRLFVPVSTVNPLDNEPAAINGDGAQLYVVAGARRGGWLLVPREHTDEVEQRLIEGWQQGLTVQATWQPTTDGWNLTATIALPPGTREIALDVLVNETAPGRERRRGQLVLSGAQGEFVYLRGDRHDASHLLRFTVPDA